MLGAASGFVIRESGVDVLNFKYSLYYEPAANLSGAHKLPSRILFVGGAIILSNCNPAVPEKPGPKRTDKVQPEKQRRNPSTPAGQQFSIFCFD